MKKLILILLLLISVFTYNSNAQVVSPVLTYKNYVLIDTNVVKSIATGIVYMENRIAFDSTLIAAYRKYVHGLEQENYQHIKNQSIMKTQIDTQRDIIQNQNKQITILKHKPWYDNKYLWLGVGLIGGTYLGTRLK